MEIGAILNAGEFQKLQDTFSTSTRLALAVVDKQGNLFTEISGNTDFCAKYAKDNTANSIFHAYPGLTSFSSDIVVKNEKLATLIGGQVFTREPNESELRDYANEQGYDAETFIAAAKKIPVVPESCVSAAKSYLSIMIDNHFITNYAKKDEAEKLEGLRDEIRHANSIIQTINANTHSLKSIANKQKMLSLNASIEAARSGEAGVGFAVVAKSMGELSSQSASIYGDIEKSVTEVTESIDKLSDFFTNE